MRGKMTVTTVIMNKNPNNKDNDSNSNINDYMNSDKNNNINNHVHSKVGMIMKAMIILIIIPCWNDVKGMILIFTVTMITIVAVTAFFSILLLPVGHKNWLLSKRTTY